MSGGHHLNLHNSKGRRLMAAAEQAAESGDIEGSKFKVTLADEIKVTATRSHPGIAEQQHMHAWALLSATCHSSKLPGRRCLSLRTLCDGHFCAKPFKRSFFTDQLGASAF
eukprot:519444-Amphidinium_carterae.1